MSVNYQRLDVSIVQAEHRLTRRAPHVPVTRWQVRAHLAGRKPYYRKRADGTNPVLIIECWGASRQPPAWLLAVAVLCARHCALGMGVHDMRELAWRIRRHPDRSRMYRDL